MPQTAGGPIRTADYRGWPSLRLESDELLVTLVPNLGGKIASLRARRSGREFLVQPVANPLAPPRPGVKFVDSDPFGLDDMFPTVAECRTETDGGRALLLPDHGEVWSRAWSCELAGDTVTLSIDCRSVPCRLTKRCLLAAPNLLRLEYQAENLSTETFDALWAAHPLLDCTEAVELDLPPGEVISVCAGSGLYGNHGTRSAWKPLVLPPARPGQPTQAHKFYAARADQVRHAGLRFPATQEQLVLRLESSAPTYFGLWHEELADGTRILAPEPCTGGFDRPDFARQHGQSCHFGPHEKKQWTLELEVGPLA
jgi:galactose mutarotase-like enzyme